MAMLFVSNGDSFLPEKLVWTHRDYEEMNWKDTWVHGIGIIWESKTQIMRELLLDLDYILKWVNPEKPAFVGNEFRFWVSPSTLVFTDVSSVKIGLEGIFNGSPLSIYDLVKAALPNYPDWLSIDIEDIHHGHITFKASGFKLFIRQKPVLRIGNSYLGIEEQGGIVFDKKAYDKKLETSH